jgi:hypothetical protein
MPPKTASHPTIDWSQYNAVLSLRAIAAYDALLVAALAMIVAERIRIRCAGRRAAHRPVRYSAAWVEALLLFRVALRTDYRAAVAIARWVLRVAQLPVPVPHAGHLAKRGQQLLASTPCWASGRSGVWVFPEAMARAVARGPHLWLAIDSTGLSLRGSHSWMRYKHGASAEERTRHVFLKQHTLVDVISGATLAAVLTPSNTPDAAMLEPLLDAVIAALPPTHHARVLAGDGAYDSRSIYAACAARGLTHVLVPPVEGAVRWTDGSPAARLRNAHFGLGTATVTIVPGSPAWRLACGAGCRSHIETSYSVQMAHVGHRLRCRSPRGQTTEAWLRLTVVNRLTLQTPCPTTHRAPSLQAAIADRPLIPPRVRGPTQKRWIPGPVGIRPMIVPTSHPFFVRSVAPKRIP